MSDKPARRFWQFHLLTLVMMALEFGILLSIETAFSKTINGWLAALFLSMEKADAVSVDEMAYLPFSLVFNAVAVVLLAFLSEWLIRRREGRKT